MENKQNWYIVKKAEGTCEIVPGDSADNKADNKGDNKKDPTILEQWGLFDSVEEAISRRVGLIRAGKCQPQ